MPGSATESTDGAPLCIKFRVARLVVEATSNSETDFDVNTTQLEESEETLRLKHKTLTRHVSRDEHDARQIAHLQSRSRSGETVDHEHRPQASMHGVEDRRVKDHFFLSNAAVPQHVKAVLNRLESGAASSVMSEDGDEARLVDAREAFRPTDRTRLIEIRAVKKPVCKTPKASSVNAGRIERASCEVEKQSRTSRSWFEGVSVDRVCKVIPDTVRNCAWQRTRLLVKPGRVKQIERPCGRSHNGQVSEFAELNHFREPKKAGDMSKLHDEWSLRLWRGTIMVSSGHWRGTPARVRRCRPILRRPENQRWVRKLLTEMNGRQEEKLQIQDWECIALKQQIKCGGQKGSMACCRHAGANPRDLRTRTQDTELHRQTEKVQTSHQEKHRTV